MAFYQGNCTLGEGNNQTSWGLLDTGFQLTLIPGDMRKYCGLQLKLGLTGGQVINGILAEVWLTVCPVGPWIHPMVISPVLKCIFEVDIHRVFILVFQTIKIFLPPVSLSRTIGTSIPILVTVLLLWREIRVITTPIKKSIQLGLAEAQSIIIVAGSMAACRYTWQFKLFLETILVNFIDHRLFHFHRIGFVFY